MNIPLKKFYLLLFLTMPLSLVAQSPKVVVQGSGNNLYINHVTEPKENFYSIGRIYNISPRVYAPVNGLDVDSGVGLSIGQLLRIPLNEINFTQDGAVADGEVTVPVYHQVAGGEDLSTVSNRYGVTINKLQQWNNRSGNQLRQGEQVIIGYLKVKSALSPLAKHAVKIPAVSAPVEKPVAVVESKPEAPKQTPPAAVVETKPEAPKQTPPAAVVEEKPVAPVTAKAPERTEAAPGEGYFSELFSGQQKGKKLKQENLTGGLFKSTSGWNDGKYYCFHNSAKIGSIVRITSAESGKSVYARVLDVIPHIGQNEGIGLRLSNSAAGALGVSTDTFDCVVAY